MLEYLKYSISHNLVLSDQNLDNLEQFAQKQLDYMNQNISVYRNYLAFVPYNLLMVYMRNYQLFFLAQLSLNHQS